MKFDVFIALDGNGLNGFEGFGGIAKLRCDTAGDTYDLDVTFFDGMSGGHATQINPGGTVGFLGNLSQNLLFFDPRTLQEIRRFSTLRFVAPEVIYQSQTHVVWLDDERFVAVLGDHFHQFHLDDLEHPERLGPHGVTLPHALKRSPSGRYLFYGAMDHDRHGYACQAGVFDLQTNEPRIVKLPATVWHLGVHPTRDVFYAPSQRCSPQGRDFGEYTIGHFKNYLFEIDGASATVLRHLAIPKDLPAALTSDVVVTEDEVLYNACAGGAIIRVDLETMSKVRFVDDRPGALRALWHWRTGWSNVVEAFSRTNVPTNTDVLIKALRATRFSSVDGSYGLQVSPDRRRIISAHRGLNEVHIYGYPSLSLLKRVPFPPLQSFYPEHFGRFDDPRLGFHHSTLSTTTVA